MTGASPILPDLGTIRALLTASRELAGPHGATLELCILTLCLPWEAVAIQLENIDWHAAFVPVPARGGDQRLLHLPPLALKAITRVAGTAVGQGQAVTAGRGAPLTQRDIRLDRLKDRLAENVPDTIGLPPWNMHGLRSAAAKELVSRGSSQNHVNLALGLKTRGVPDPFMATRSGRAELEQAVTVVGRWNAILLDRRIKS